MGSVPLDSNTSETLQVEMLQDVYLTYATQQADTLQKLEQEVDMFASKHNNMVMRSRDHANHLHINTESFIRVCQIIFYCFLDPYLCCLSIFIHILVSVM